MNEHPSNVIFEKKYLNKKNSSRPGQLVDYTISILCLFINIPWILEMQSTIDIVQLAFGILLLMAISLFLFGLFFPLTRGYIRIDSSEFIFNSQTFYDPLIPKKARYSFIKNIVIDFDKDNDLLLVRNKKDSYFKRLSIRGLEENERKDLIKILKTRENVIINYV